MKTSIQTDTANPQKGLSRNRAAKKRRRQNRAVWVLQAMLAVAFVVTGFSKVAGHATMIASFEQLGFGQSFRLLIGSIEVVFGAFLLSPLLAPAAATILMCTMLGAISAHLTILGGSAIPAFALGTLCGVVVWYRWSDSAMQAPAQVRARAVI